MTRLTTLICHLEMRYKTLETTWRQRRPLAADSQFEDRKLRGNSSSRMPLPATKRGAETQGADRWRLTTAG
jgi:hypothetical protein